MKKHDLFSKKQYGLIEGRSTPLQLVKVTDERTEILDEGGTCTLGVHVVYMDSQKAFDTVPHRRLLSMLQHYGIKGKVLRWIKDFLSCRTQRVPPAFHDLH